MTADLVNRFVDYFWDGADDSVKDYVKGTLNDLLSETNEDEASSNIVADLIDFLPPGQDPSQLAEAVQQLQSAAVAEAQRPHKTNHHPRFIWLRTPEPPVTTTSIDNKEKGALNVSSFSLKYAELQVSAAEFKPPCFTPDADAGQLADDIAALDLGSQQYDEFYHEGDGEEAGLYSCDEFDHAAGYSSCEYSPEQQQQLPQPQHTNGDPLDENAILAVLQHNFPAYSSVALKEMFVSCGRSLPAAIDVLYKLENELYGVQQQQQQQQDIRNACKDTEKVEFNAADFPSLGGTEEKRSLSAATPLAFGANYAGRAKAAAHLPAPCAQRPKNPNTASTGSSSSTRGVGAAPIWQAQGEIEKFSTGTSVAAEYAEARAEARDHARARNVCFENATQAYISGNKALAKELGAKGRWHNERMKLLHAQAANETFSRRNAATLAGTHSSSSSRSHNGSSGAPPTIDLHGLHVSEALHHLDRALENLQQRRVSKARVVVGVGQHGKVPARLKTAVEGHLSGIWKLRYREPYEGLLEVNLT